MADENWIDKLKPDFKVTRKLYHFPTRGTNRYNLLGEPVRIKSYEFNGPEESDPGYGNLSQCIVTAANYTVGELSLDFNPVGFAFSNYLRLRPEIGGGHRTFHAFFQSYGSVVPVTSETVASALQTGAEIVGAVSRGVGGVVGYLLGLVTGGGSAGRIDAQPFPSHHIGVLKIEETLEGVVLEGGARSPRSGAYSAARVKSVCIVYTDEYFEFMTIAYPKWIDFYQLPQIQRQNQVATFQGFLRAREDWIKRKRERRLDPINDNPLYPPDPTYQNAVHPWLIWAWERGLDVTAPPADPRRSGYNPNLNYNKTRDWFTY